MEEGTDRSGKQSNKQAPVVALKEEPLNLFIGQVPTLLKMCTAGPELFKILCLRSRKHEKKKGVGGEKKPIIKLAWLLFMCREKMMRVTSCTMEERRRGVQPSFSESVTELPSLITLQRENSRVFRKN